LFATGQQRGTVSLLEILQKRLIFAAGSHAAVESRHSGVLSNVSTK